MKIFVKRHKNGLKNTNLQKWKDPAQLNTTETRTRGGETSAIVAEQERGEAEKNLAKEEAAEKVLTDTTASAGRGSTSGVMLGALVI